MISRSRREPEHSAESTAQSERVPLHVASLVSYIPPHQADIYRAYSSRFQRYTIMVSTKMERHRIWEADWDGLEVIPQRTYSIASRWRHAMGFTDKLDIHLPLDTLGLLRKHKPDVVLSGELGFRSLCSAIYCLFNRDTPLVLWACVSEHTEQGRGWLRYWLRRWLIRQADGMIVNGSSGKRYVTQFGIDPKHVYEVPYSTPQGLFDQAPLERSAEAAHRLLYVGQLSERKGISLLLPALQRWAEANPERSVELTVVGGGPLADTLKQEESPENLQITYLGWQTHEQIADHCANSGILVFPTLADEWGLVVNEAMSAGMPVLGSLYSASVEEFCIEGETGWCFRPDQEEEMYNAIDRAMNTPVEQLNKMRQECRTRIGEISPSKCADRLAAAIMNIGQRSNLEALR